MSSKDSLEKFESYIKNGEYLLDYIENDLYDEHRYHVLEEYFTDVKSAYRKLLDKIDDLRYELD